MSHNKRNVAHDHFVYLLTTEDFENLPAWLTSNFNIIEGGTHAGGSSRNKLIIFKDGTYLELFNWISEPKEFQAWADKPPGLIDFALTTLPPTTAQQNFIAISQGLEAGGDADLGVSFDHPRTGGRKRKDGVDVKWETTRAIMVKGKNTPDSSYFPTHRLDVPFFCDDITERTVRVPFEDDDVTNHPCGAIGISDVEILVPRSHFEHYVKLYRVILGSTEKHSSGGTYSKRACFDVAVPNSQGISTTMSIVASPDTSADVSGNSSQDWLHQRGIGIRSLMLTGDGQGSHYRRGLDSGQTSSSILLVGTTVNE